MDDAISLRAVTAAVRYEPFMEEDLVIHEGIRWVKFDAPRACKRRFSQHLADDLKEAMWAETDRRGNKRFKFHTDTAGVLWVASPKRRG